MLHDAVFHEGLHCLLRQKLSSELEIEFLTCDPSIYTMDHQRFIVPKQKDESISTQRAKLD